MTCQSKAKGANCEACVLFPYAMVAPEVNLDATFAVVGDFPGADDEREKRPFTGRGGNEISLALSQCGVQRGAVHWTYTVLCRPPSQRGARESASKAMERLLRRIRNANQKKEKREPTAKKGKPQPRYL